VGGNPDALSAKIIKILTMSDDKKQDVALRARKHIKKNYSVDTMVDQTMRLYEELGVC